MKAGEKCPWFREFMTLTELNWSKKMERQNLICSTTKKTDWRAMMRDTEPRVGRTTLEKL